jgi:hypothetical protein
MMPLLAVLVAGAPCVYWTQGVDSRPTLEAAHVMRVCVPSELLGPWKATGFPVSGVDPADLAAREALPPPGITSRVAVASPTRSPWIVANGWRFTRRPDGKYVYDVPPGKAALTMAEAYAYGADAVLRIDPADLGTVGDMQQFLAELDAVDLPPIADIGVVDDGTPVTGEVMNLLTRRNLLYEPVRASSSRFPINIEVGSSEYPVAAAANPSELALKVRRQLSDDKRSLRVFGSEVVICRLTGNAERIRLHLINYAGREIEGLRIRVRGAYGSGVARVAGAGRLPLSDHTVAGGFTEFSVPRIATYAVIDLVARLE